MVVDERKNFHKANKKSENFNFPSSLNFNFENI